MTIQATKNIEQALNYHTAAQNFMKQKQYKNAVVSYLNSLMIDKENIKTYISLSKAYKILKEYDKAVKYLNMAKKISEETFEIHYELGINHLLNAEPYKAVFCFQKAIMLNPKNLNDKFNLQFRMSFWMNPKFL